MRKITRALGMFHVIPDVAYLKAAYRLEFGKRLNLNDPVTLNEKFQWLKLNGAMGRFTELTDKWMVRDHVRRVLGEEYLVPVIGVYDHAKQIPWDMLPDQFVAKCTHGSHCGVICTNKKAFGRHDAERKLTRWMKRDWFWFGREPVYRNAKPKVLIERFIGEDSRAPADYKVMCYHGEPSVVQVHEKVNGFHTIDFFDLQGNRLDIDKTGFRRSEREKLDAALLAPLLSAARKLAQSVDTPYLRTDFYCVEGHVYFSELTFFDSSGFRGFEPEVADRWLGGMLKLDRMRCPRCWKPMRWYSIEGSKWCDHVVRYDRCTSCGHERMVVLEASS